jgi:hypothetical protein
VFLTQWPYLDEDELLKVETQYKEYMDKMAQYGFNAIEFQAFLELIDFDMVGNGYEVYKENSIYRQRHQALREVYGEFFRYAHEKGFKVIISTDMVALTPPLESYIQQELGSLDVNTDRSWNVYEKGLDELFVKMPEVDGVMLRIGEAGPLYNRDGWEYRSELMVRSVESVKCMLRSFLNTAERHDKDIIFRTWSVGVGTLGAMHTDPALYNEIFDDIESPNLIVSTKLTKGDFWNNVELNPTLFQGKQRRIVELQARREFEAFNVIPNFIGPIYKEALTEFLASNHNVEGVWVWTQGGGPIRQGPMMIYPFHGLWLWTDANVYVTSQIVQNPAIPVEELTRRWVRNTFGGDSEVEDNLTELLMMSHPIAVKGLTIPQFAKKLVSGVGLEIPPVIYSYWDIVAASTTVTSLIYETAQNDVQAAIDEGFSAVNEVRHMKRLLSSVENKIEKGRHWIPGLVASLEYQENLFETLAYHKQFVLKYYQWLDKGGKSNDIGWQIALDEYNRAKNSHIEKYGNNLNLPAYNFKVADNGARQVSITGKISWASRTLLVVILIFIVALIKISESKSSHLLIPVLLSLIIIAFLEIFTSISAPYFVLTTSIPLLIYVYGLRFIVFRNGKSGGFTRVVLPILIILAGLLLVLSIRGPYFFWFNYWTNDIFRYLLTSAFAVLVLMHFYLIYKLTKGGLIRRQVIGLMCIIAGFLVSLYCMIYLAVGLEKMLMILNDEVLIMPVMVSRVLTFSTHLDNIVNLLVYGAYSGLILIAGGSLLCISQIKKIWFLK